MASLLFDLPERKQPGDTFFYERFLHRSGVSLVAGTDEVGRGPLAGPVVAACVILPKQCDLELLQDSKKLSPKKRTLASEYIHSIDAVIGIGIVSHKVIDKINILQASLLAMKLAAEKVSAQAGELGFILVDGKFEIPSPVPQAALIKGESKSASIAAASIIAKCYRDGLMKEMDALYPVYNFKRNMGYPTKEHRNAINMYGSCPIHRKSFRGVKQIVSEK